MKRRILALICAATMVVGMGISASASTSATADDIASVKVPGTEVKAEGDAVTIATNEGATVTIDLSSEAVAAVAEEISNAVESAPKNATITPVALSKNNATAITKRVAEIAKFVDKAEVKVVDIKADEKGTFTLNLNIQAGQSVKVLHCVADGVIEEIACTVAGGKVTFTAETYSDFAFVITTGEVQEDDEEDSAPAESTGLPTTSPATAGAFASVAVLALVSGGASVAFGRKSKKN